METTNRIQYEAPRRGLMSTETRDFIVTTLTILLVGLVWIATEMWIIAHPWIVGA